MCAALSAQHAGCSVLVLEGAPRHFRGGNSRHTRDIRYMHEVVCPYVTGTYLDDEFWDDLWRVTSGETDETLARLTIRSSANLIEWSEAHGAEWQSPLRGTLQLSRTNVFMLGGGTGLMNSYYATAAKMGVQVAYDADVAFLVMLNLTSLTGLLVLIFRSTTAMGLLLALHLGVVAALFITMPYGKFAHVVYRYAALVRNGVEQRRASAATGAHH